MGIKMNLLLKIAFGCVAAAPVAQAAQQPNVLFILVDDFGWKDVGYNGSTFYETPCLDQLSTEWMRFDNCYTPSPMCSPTRTSILTGKNPARHGVTQWLRGTDQAFVRKGETPQVYCPAPLVQGLKESEVTLGEAFQEADYETAFYGKWHMGKLTVTGGPARHGYDSQLAVIEENGCKEFDYTRYFKNATPGRSFTDALTDAAIDFVRAPRDKPFYLHLCHHAMHYPIATTPELRARFEQKKQRQGITAAETLLDDYAHVPVKLQQDSSEYAGELFNLDSSVGRLIEALKESGQYENTIIVFTGDNGGRSTVNKPNATAIMPLRGGKTFVFDGGLKTPCLIYWPGHTTAGMQTGIPITSMDFYPSLLEMAGLAPRPEQHVDGVSVVPLFTGKTLARDTLYWHFPHYQGEGSYPASAIRVGDYKLVHHYHQGDVLLFDLATDPNETHDLAAALPEKAAALDEQLMAYLNEAGAYIPQAPTSAQLEQSTHPKKRQAKNNAM